MTQGQDFAEIKVIISDDEQRLVKKFPTYHSGFTVSQSGDFLNDLVKQAKADFKGRPEKISVNINIVWE